MTAGAAPITVLNNSFELPDTATFNSGPITSWVQSDNTSGVFEPASFAPAGAGFMAGVTGTQTAYINGNDQFIYQTLTDTLAVGSYSLMVDVGDREDANNPLYSIQLLAGATVLGSVTETNFATPNTGWVGATLNYSALAGNGDLGQALRIQLTKTGGGQVNFDNVRLSFTAAPNDAPEPGSLALVGLALAAVGSVAARRRGAKALD